MTRLRRVFNRLNLWSSLALLTLAHTALAALWWRRHDALLLGAALSIPLTLLALYAQQPLPRRVHRGLRFVFFWFAYDINLTFASFYGRFVSTSELHLMANNSIGELLASLALYFSWGALLCAAAMACVWDQLAEHAALHRPASAWRPTLRALRPAIALLVWLVASVLLKTQFRAVPLADPVADYASTLIIQQVEQAVHRAAPKIERQSARIPTNPPPPFDILYVVGESFRADRFPPSHYARPVTPFLSHLTQPHLAFSNVTSHGDCTGRSVPYLMVEPQPPFHINLFRSPTLFQYAHEAGFETSFIYSNENDWREFVEGSIDHLHRNRELKEGSGDWLFNDDRAMLPVIAQHTHAPKPQFIVIESYTSHWPYADRYRRCKSCRLYRPDNQGEPMPFAERYRLPITNSYDNAITYFDQFFQSIVQQLTKPTLIVFTSDHGESIGDQGRWGHCSQGPEQMRVPLLIIATDPAVAKAARLSELAAKQNLAIGHAQLFKTLLTWMGYAHRSLDLAYPPSLFDVTEPGVADRTVLVSEIGFGLDPVSIAHLTPHADIRTIDTAIPNDP